jgi:site-specific DNA-methyltransferase (adenine-specific)
VNLLPTFAQRGDIAPLLNRIHHCDALELLKRLPDASVDSVVSDIPYGEVNKADSGIRTLNKGNADVITFDINHLALEVARVAKQWACLFVSTEQTSPLRAAWQPYGMTRLLIWQKTNPTPLNCEYIWLSDIECCVVLRKKSATFNRFYESAVIKHEAGSSKEHPTQKPLGLIEYLIESVSNVGDVILDPFVGSGTTAIAARNLGRNFIAGDSYLPYVEMARLRLMNTDPFLPTVYKTGEKQLSLFSA